MIMSAHEDYLHWMVHKPSELPFVAGLSMMNGINNFFMGDGVVCKKLVLLFVRASLPL